MYIFKFSRTQNKSIKPLWHWGSDWMYPFTVTSRFPGRRSEQALLEFCLYYQSEAIFPFHKGCPEVESHSPDTDRAGVKASVCQCVVAGTMCPHAREARAERGLESQHLMHRVASCSPLESWQEMTLFNPAELPRFTGLIATHGKEIMFIFKTLKKKNATFPRPLWCLCATTQPHTHTRNVCIITSN